MDRRFLRNFALLGLAPALAGAGLLVLLVRPGCACLPPPPAAAPAGAVAAVGGIPAAVGATFSVHPLDAADAAPVGAAFRDARTGLVVTNAHVVGTAAAVILAAADGRRARAAVIARDEVKDLAALAPAIPDAPGLAPADGPPPVPGDPVFAIGAPLGLGHSVTRGVVSALQREIDARTPYGALQHDAALNPGSSGGPLVRPDGRFLGLNAAMPDGFRRHVGVGYAIPAAVVARFLDDAAAGRPIGTRRIGLQARAVAGEMARALALPAESGVLVEAVEPAAAAAKAGLEPGDVVVAAAGRTVGRAHDLTVAVDAVPIDRPVPVEALRRGARIRLELPGQPAEAPAAAADRPEPGADAAAAPLSAAALGLAFAAGGEAAVIAEPAPGSAAAAAGLGAGETVVAVGTAPVASAAAALRLIAARPAPPLALLVRAVDGATRYVLVDPARRPVDGLGERGNIRPRDSVAF